jgi:hypothetical protein
MRPRYALTAALGLALLGCEDPETPRPDAPGEMPPPVAPSDTGAGGAAGVVPRDDVERGAVVIRGSETPPLPAPVLGVVGSCDARGVEPLCFVFSGTGWTPAAAQAECARAEGGVFQSAACPTDDRIGECVYRPEGDAAREIVYTFYAPMEPLIAEAVCRGTFRAF